MDVTQSYVTKLAHLVSTGMLSGDFYGICNINDYDFFLFSFF